MTSLSLFSSLPERVNIVEVGPRDGLQNESLSISAQDKVDFVNQLSQVGCKHIEAASFVSPKWVPQMASSDEVMRKIQRQEGIVYSALTPNVKGFEAAIAANADQVAIFAAASESFSQKNINCSIAQSIQRFEPILESAIAKGIKVRAYVSCVLGCPYDGEIAADDVVEVAKTLIDMGCYEVSLGDTIGVGTPLKTAKLIEACLQYIPASKLAGHFHDTYGQALANVLTALTMGINTFDSSVAGLGGCPYAKGASGNLASEDLVYMLHKMNIKTGIDLNRLIRVGHNISGLLQRKNASKVGLALNT